MVLNCILYTPSIEGQCICSKFCFKLGTADMETHDMFRLFGEEIMSRTQAFTFRSGMTSAEYTQYLWHPFMSKWNYMLFTLENLFMKIGISLLMSWLMGWKSRLHHGKVFCCKT